MGMDVNRLHSVINGSLQGRQCGRSYAMCVEILQNTDFVVDPIYVYAGTRQRAEWLKQFFWRVAVEMGYESIENRKRWELRINGVRIIFGHKKPQAGYEPCLEYLDHDYYNVFEWRRY